MSAEDQIPAEKLRELLDYNPETGDFVWRKRGLHWFKDGGKPAIQICNRWNNINADKPALTSFTAKGYLMGTLLGVNVRAHRVAWAIMTGAWSEKQIDHLNGVRTDNRWSNLREVEPIQNSQNMRRPKNNTSGRIGVSELPNGWQAYISINRKRISLGTFDTFAAAVAARRNAEREAGYHPNHGR